MILRIAMIGFGNVGQEFARLLLAKRDWLLRTKGLDAEVLAIATKTKGSLISKRALDLDKCLRLIKEDGSLSAYGPETTTLSPKQIIGECDADLMIELSPLNIKTGQPAIDHIKAALESGMDVITANKGPIAFAYSDLIRLARSKGVHFRFEGTVMDGTPVFNLVEKTLPGCEILGLSGILNSTSNFVLAEMASGKSMEDAIKIAQKRGFAEADPSLDIEGWDAAAKITALANVMMDARANPKLVDRQGIGGVSQLDIEKAARQRKKVKLIASAVRTGDCVKLSVKPEIIGTDDPFWSVDGTSSALTIKTDLMGDITIVERDHLVTQTAYAVFSDLLLVLESIRSGTIR
jgi:homoserine dehydrogenase